MKILLLIKTLHITCSIKLYIKEQKFKNSHFSVMQFMHNIMLEKFILHNRIY